MIGDKYTKFNGAGVSRSTATLMKTGQLISYRAGDDGDLEAGRDLDLFTLAENNPFGNTNRFTKTDGTAGASGNVQWIIDWSTYNGTTVLGYVNYFWSLGSYNWNNAIDYCNGYSLNSYAGCRLANVYEIQNLINYNSTGLNYLPFGGSGSLSTWTSTTLSLNSIAAHSTGFFDNTIQYTDKTSSIYALPVRTFTVTGTTLS